jgi:hypothetical protein
VNYAKLLEMNSFFTLHVFLEVGKTQDLLSKFWQTLVDALNVHTPLYQLDMITLNVTTYKLQ